MLRVERLKKKVSEIPNRYVSKHPQIEKKKQNTYLWITSGRMERWSIKKLTRGGNCSD